MCPDVTPDDACSPMIEPDSAIPAQFFPKERRRAPRLVPELFAGIESPTLDEILAGCTVREVVDGEVILSPGQRNRVLYILLSGRIRIYLDEKDSQFIDIKPGECVGEMSIIEDRPASAYVVAEGAGRILVIPEDDFWQLISSTPDRKSVV